MITLLLDNKQVIIKNGTSIKLTRENPFFTGSGDYTLDVTLPLAGCKQNLEVFGMLHFAPVSHKPLATKKFAFRLLTELVQLEGQAVITNVTHEEVKIQLLSGNSALNLNALGDKGEQYIDELDLGNAYGELWDKNYTGSRYYTRQTAENTATWLSALPKSRRNALIHGTREETDCVCFPIYSLADEAFSNEHGVNYWGGIENNFWVNVGENYSLKHPTDSFPDDGEERAILSWSYGSGVCVAPQPYLSFVLERILSALGFVLDKRHNALHTKFGRVFVANARHTVRIAECLPHWTIDKFLKELKNLFGVYVFVEGTRAYVKTRSNYFEGNTVEIHHAISDHTTDIDDEGEQQDTTSGNVAYAFTEAVPRILNIGEDAYEKMDVIKVKTYQEAETAFDEMTGDERVASNVLFYVENTGRRYASLSIEDEWQLCEVDHVGPLFRDDDFEIDTELKIIPAATSRDIVTKRYRYVKVPNDRRGIYAVEATYPSDGYTGHDGGLNGGYHIPYLVTADSRNPQTGTLWSLHEAIVNETDTDAEENPKQEVMEIGVVSTANYVSDYLVGEGNYQVQSIVSVPYAVGVPYMVEDGLMVVSSLLERANDLDFRNTETKTGQVMQGNLNIDTRVVRQISFTDDVCDPNAIYLINGRKYLCQKIELTLDTDGVQPLKKGYFFEIE